MIIDALLSLLTWILDIVFGWLPDWNWFDMYSNAAYPLDQHTNSVAVFPIPGGGTYSPNPINTILFYMVKWNQVLPIYECLMLMNGVMVFAVGFAAWRAIAWIVGVIRGSGTST